jgi:YfiH family protein
MREFPLTKKKANGKSFFSLRLKGNAIFATSTKEFSNVGSFCKTLNIKEEDLVSMEQAHGDGVEIATQRDRGKIMPAADALITKDPNTPLLARTADCVPIFILDQETPAIGAIHAGWKGSIKKIAVKTLEAMKEAFDTEAENCIIAMAPSIGQCCYEVDEKVMMHVRDIVKEWKATATPAKDGKWMLNLSKLNELQLINAGVKKGNFTSSKLCTSCNKPLFHSWRRDGERAGRMFSIAMMGGRG